MRIAWGGYWRRWPIRASLPRTGGKPSWWHFRWAHRNLPRITDAAIGDAEARLFAAAGRERDPTPTPGTGGPPTAVHSTAGGPATEVLSRHHQHRYRRGKTLHRPGLRRSRLHQGSCAAETQPATSAVVAAETHFATRDYTARVSTTGPDTEVPPTTITTGESTARVSSTGPDTEVPPPTTITTRDPTARVSSTGPDAEAPPPATSSCRPRHPTGGGSSECEGMQFALPSV